MAASVRDTVRDTVGDTLRDSDPEYCQTFCRTSRRRPTEYVEHRDVRSLCSTEHMDRETASLEKNCL